MENVLRLWVLLYTVKGPEFDGFSIRRGVDKEGRACGWQIVAFNGMETITKGDGTDPDAAAIVALQNLRRHASAVLDRLQSRVADAKEYLAKIDAPIVKQ